MEKHYPKLTMERLEKAVEEASKVFTENNKWVLYPEPPLKPDDMK